MTRGTVPGSRRVRDHGIAWLAVLAEAPQSMAAVTYALHDNGFAGHMARSPQVTRYYLQVPTDDAADAWPDGRIWAELRPHAGRPVYSRTCLPGPARGSARTAARPGQGRGDPGHGCLPLHAGSQGLHRVRSRCGRLLSRVLHDWDDLQCRAILATCAAAMPDHAESHYRAAR